MPNDKISGIIYFLVDTGASISSICEKDAVGLKIDCALLLESKGEAIGFGGTFKTKMINKTVNLIFNCAEGKHKIPYASGFRVMCFPREMPPDKRERLLRLTPSVLGMDVLCKFKTCIDKKRVELTLE